MREVKREKECINKLEKQMSTEPYYFQSEEERLLCLDSSGAWEGRVPQSQVEEAQGASLALSPSGGLVPIS